MRSIFVFALLLSCLVGVLMAEKEELLLQVVEECASENGVSLNDLGKVIPGVTNPDDVNENIKCVIQCALEKVEFIDGNGKLQPDKILSFATTDEEKDKIEGALASCDNIPVNSCDSAYEVFDCFSKYFGPM